MKALRSLSCLAVIFFVPSLASAALAQFPGVPSSESAALLKVTATPPFRMGSPGGDSLNVRLMFRVLSAEDRDLPFLTVGHNGEVFQWVAFSSRGAKCTLDEYALTGVGVFNPSSSLSGTIGELQKKESSQWVANKTRPSIVVADFRCDRQVQGDDTVTVQIRFYVRGASYWTAADYTFENLGVSQ